MFIFKNCSGNLLSGEGESAGLLQSCASALALLRTGSGWRHPWPPSFFSSSQEQLPGSLPWSSIPLTRKDPVGSACTGPRSHPTSQM